MGWNAYDIGIDFVIPGARVADALAAVKQALGDEVTVTGQAATANPSWPSTTAAETLVELLDNWTSFDRTIAPDGSVRLTAHCETWGMFTERILAALAPFTPEGSYVRLRREDDRLFGYRVVRGQLVTESGDYTWELDDKPPPTVYAAEALATLLDLAQTQLSGCDVVTDIQRGALDTVRAMLRQRGCEPFDPAVAGREGRLTALIDVIMFG